jgi:hypothetical protein
VIRTRAVKFIYVLSRTSNESNRGFRKELHLADSEAKKLTATLPRFVICEAGTTTFTCSI